MDPSEREKCLAEIAAASESSVKDLFHRSEWLDEKEIMVAFIKKSYPGATVPLVASQFLSELSERLKGDPDVVIAAGT